MAIKVGEAYVEIYPRINKAQRDKAIAQVTKDFKKAFEQSYRDSAAADDRRAAHSERTDRDILDSRRNTERETRRERDNTDRNEERNHKKSMARAKNEEGQFHKLAVAFRTIGTVGRGLIIGSAVLSSWAVLRDGIAVMAKAAPLVTAGLAGLPFLISAAAAEVVVLGVAFHGVGTAIKDAFNPKKQKQYNEELQKLAPAARSFVKEIAKLQHLKLPNLQQAFFGNQNIQQTGKNIKPFVQKLAPGAAKLAAANGGAIGNVTKTITGPSGISAFSAVLKTMTTAIKNFTPGLGKITDGFLKLTQHVAELGNGKTGKAFNKWLTDMGNKMANVDAKAVFSKAKKSWEDLKRLGGDLKDIFKGVYQALTGGPQGNESTFRAFGNFVHTIADFVRSGTGKIFLQQLSGTLTTLSNLASSLTGSALHLLAGIFENLYPAIKPLADVIAKIGKDLVPLGPLIGTVLASACNSLKEMLKKLEPKLKSTIIWMVNHPEEIKKIAGAILIIVGAIKILGTTIGIIKRVREAFVTLNLTMLANPFGLIALAIAALVLVFIYCYNHSETLRKAVDGLKKAFDSLGKELGIQTPAFKTVAKFIGGMITRYFIGLVLSYTIAIKNMTLIIRGVKWVFKEVVDFVTSKVIPFFKKTLPDAFLKCRDWIVYAFRSVTHNIQAWWSNTVNFFTGKVKNFFLKTVPGWFLKFRDWVVYAYNWIVNHTHSVWSGIINFFTGKVKNFFIKTIPGWFASLRNQIGGVWDNMFHRAAGFIGRIKDFFTKNLKDFFVKTIPSWGETLRKSILNTWQVFYTNLYYWWKKAYNSLRDFAQTIMDKVWDNGLVKYWNHTLAGKIAGLVGLHPPKHITIPTPFGRAAGGPISGPGGPRQDLIPAMLSNGEYVINAKATSMHRPLIEAINQSGRQHFAGGGAVAGIEALQRAVGPHLRVTSTTGGGHAKNSYHYRGMAVDFAGSQRAMDVAANNLMKFSGYILELIHSPNWFVKNMHRVGRGTYASVYGAHFNHVHLAMSAQAAAKALADKKSGKISGFGGFGPGAMALPAIAEMIHKQGAFKVFGPIYKKLSGITDPAMKATGKMPIDFAVTNVNSAVASMVAAAQAAAASFGNQTGATNLGRLSGQIGSWIGSASHFANIPNSWVRGMEYIISRESSGNPKAHNPSGASGIMQMMPGTFRAHHAKGTSSNIYDPVANIAAAANYIHARWKDPYGTPWYHGGHWYAKGGPVMAARSYDQGGVLKPGWTAAYNGTGKNEFVSKGFPGTLQVVLRVDEFTKIMDTRIAKHENDVIQYIQTR